MWALTVALIIALASAVALRRHAEAPQRAGEEYLAALAAGDRETLRALGAWSPGDSSTLLLDREGTAPTTGLLEELRVEGGERHAQDRDLEVTATQDGRQLSGRVRATAVTDPEPGAPRWQLPSLAPGALLIDLPEEVSAARVNGVEISAEDLRGADRPLELLAIPGDYTVEAVPASEHLVAAPQEVQVLAAVADHDHPVARVDPRLLFTPEAVAGVRADALAERDLCAEERERFTGCGAALGLLAEGERGGTVHWEFDDEPELEVDYRGSGVGSVDTAGYADGGGPTATVTLTPAGGGQPRALEVRYRIAGNVTLEDDGSLSTEIALEADAVAP